MFPFRGKRCRPEQCLYITNSNAHLGLESQVVDGKVWIKDPEAPYWLLELQHCGTPESWSSQTSDDEGHEREDFDNDSVQECYGKEMLARQEAAQKHTVMGLTATSRLSYSALLQLLFVSLYRLHS